MDGPSSWHRSKQAPSSEHSDCTYTTWLEIKGNEDQISNFAVIKLRAFFKGQLLDK